MVLLAIWFLISIVFSFLCSIWEAVILSVTPSYINKKVQEGSKVGELLQEYKKDIDRPLSAILTLNTIAHTVGAIGVGAKAGELFGTNYFNIGITEISFESIIAVLMTLSILILSEIIPKTIGANMWQSLAPFTVKSIRILIWILTPLVWVSQQITKNLKKDKYKSVFSKADFAAMATVGYESGTLEENESVIIHNLLRLEKLKAKDIMTPRAVMITADESQKIEDFYKSTKPLQFSRIPIHKGSNDKITGTILKDDMLIKMAENEGQLALSEIKRDVIFVRDDLELPKLLDILVTRKYHMAIVNDQYGTVVGLVTMEDLFETLLGLEIVDESDKVEDLQRYARNKWEERMKNLRGEDN